MAIDFNTEPYFDDYDANKDFYKILFRPSYAVQARELTQIQTILQNQVSRFGDHIFKNGSQVIPGSVNVDNKVHFIKLEQFTGTVDVTTYIETFKNKIITGETSGVRMRVLDTSGGTAVVDQLNFPTLYCKIEGTADDNTTNRLLPGENIIAYTDDNLISTNFRLTEDQLSDITAVVKLTGNVGETPTTYTDNESSDVLGYAYSVDVAAGIYYVDGIFVRNDDLKLYVGRFNSVPSARVGFRVTEQTITPEDDESILDNATGSYNFAAPGAHRFKITLSLVKLPLVSTDSFKFIELVRIVDGRVQQQVTSSSYAELEKTLARRTYDESGNYEVNKFKLSTRDHLNDGTNQGVYLPLIEGEQVVAGTTYGDKDKFVVVVDPGKAYIQGYEVESTTSQFVEFDKARVINNDEGNHVLRVTEQNIGLNLGNYVEINNMYKAPSISSFEKVYLVKTQQPRIAQAHAIVSGGVITSVIVDDPGSGYTGSFTSNSIVQSLTPAGSGANLTVNVTNGSVSSITVVSGGTGYDNTITPAIKLTQNIYVDSAGAALNGSNAPAVSNIVGTARVRSVQLVDPDVIQTKSIYDLGLFDIQMFSGYSFERDVKSIVGITGGLNFAADINPTQVQIPGTASVTTGGNTISGQGTLFTQYLKTGDIVYVNGVKAGTVQTVSSDYSIILSGNGLTNQTNGRITVFNAKLHEPTFETLLFPVGRNNIKTLRGYSNGADTVKATSITVRRQFPIVNASNNKVLFEVTNADETLLSDTDLSNYTLINADTNIPVYVTTDDQTKCYITFNSDTNRKVVNFWNVPAGNYYLIASVFQTTSAAQEKQKSLNKIDGVMTLEDSRVATSNSIQLLHGDIFKLVKVEMTPDSSFIFDPQKTIDITSRYELDNGQRSTYYGYGKINLRPGQPVPTGAIRITYWYFQVTNTYDGNYFSVDSYLTNDVNAIGYDEIPKYYVSDKNTGKKVEVSLSDVLDFRPILTTTNGFNPQLPKIGSDVQCPFAHYVGRIDKIAVDSFGKFNIIKGVPGLQPKAPEDPKEGLVLGTINIPAYTKSVKDVVIKQRDNRRYTMRDIGKLERRISSLEYYVSLSLLEKDTAALQIKDASTGLDAFKNGFIVDQFTGHGVGDVRHIDYKCSVDSLNKVLRPSFSSSDLGMVEDLVSGSDRGNQTYQKTNDVITVPYTEQAYIFNNNATRSMDIHAISMGAFKGQISLFPESDNWKSVNRRPDLVAVDDNNYDAIKYMADKLGVTGTQWNEWQSHWTAISASTNDWETRIFDKIDDTWGDWLHVTGYQTTVTEESAYATRGGVNTTISSSVNTQNYGDRVVDMSYIPYMRSRPVTYVAKNLKNTTKFYPFFDNVPVGAYVKPADTFRVTRVSNSVMSFDLYDLQNNILQDDPKRSSNGISYQSVVGEAGGNIEPAFGVGDVLTNTTHVPTNIVSIANLTTAAASFSFVVQDSNNIKPGNHVLFYNLNYHNAVKLKQQYDDYSDTVINTSIGITNPSATSKQLNLRVFKVIAVSGGNITVANLDGSLIEPFDAYSTASYSESYRGKVYRLKASGVVVHNGEIYSSDSIGPIQQDISVVNIKNGFAVGETLTGSVTIRTTGSFNGVNIDQINGSNLVASAPTMKKLGDSIITDSNGTSVGVFYIPETEELSFRTGERTFKLTDNASNSNASFDSNGSAVYYAQGIALDKERTVVSSRAVEFVQADVYQDSRVLGIPAMRRTTTTTTVTYQYAYDPLAQTFTVNSPGGVFVTSLDLYFQNSGRRPISIELRPTLNGVPSATKSIPFSKVTKIPSEIIVSDDSSKKTTFDFAAPIYLQDGETYAFVVMTDEPGAQMFVSEMGQSDMLTGNTIAGQPLTGSLYASQNAKEWEIHTLLDAKFTLKTAKFNTSSLSTVYFRATPPSKITLPVDPLYLVTPASVSDNLYVRVTAPNHGLLSGQSVTLSGVGTGLWGANSDTVGIPETLLNATHTVLSLGLEKDSFLISLVTNEIGTGNNLLKGVKTDLVTGNYGGSGISCSRGLPLDTLFFKTSDLSFPDTKIEYFVKTLKENQQYTDWVPFIANTNYNFVERMNVPPYDNFPIVDNVVSSPVQIKAVISTDNPNVSPLIDMQQIAAYCISNNINKPSASVINVPALDTRVLLTQGDISDVDIASTGTGTVTASTSQTSVGGSGTLFLSQVFAGNVLYKSSDNTVIGTVASVQSNTSLTLTANAQNAASASGFYVTTNPNLVFENDSEGRGLIRTNIDTADNLLSSAGIGKYITIAGVASGINGTYLVRDVQVVEDKTVYAGNVEYDVVRITLEGSFSTSATINMITDPDFSVSILDRYTAETAPYGSSNLSNYITRTLSLSQAAENIKIMFDGNLGNGTEVSVYYRTWTGDVNLNKLRWVDSGFVSVGQDSPGSYSERSIDVVDVPAFNNIQVKITMRSSNPTVVPKIKNLRVLALS